MGWIIQILDMVEQVTDKFPLDKCQEDKCEGLVLVRGEPV